MTRKAPRENRAVAAGHTGFALHVLMKHHNPKAVISHMEDELVDDGEKTFEELALADHDCLEGDHINDGANLSKAVHKALVYEFIALPVDMTERQLLLAKPTVDFLVGRSSSRPSAALAYDSCV